MGDPLTNQRKRAGSVYMARNVTGTRATCNFSRIYSSSWVCHAMEDYQQ